MFHHLIVGTDTWCTWTGCQAGHDLAKKTGLYQCQYPSRRQAKAAAQVLRPHFKHGVVKVVAGACPQGPA